MTFREDLADNVCAMVPLWKSLFALEVIFLILVAGAWLIGTAGPARRTLLVINLAVIVPTMAALVLTLRWCARREEGDRELGGTRQ